MCPCICTMNTYDIRYTYIYWYLWYDFMRIPQPTVTVTVTVSRRRYTHGQVVVWVQTDPPPGRPSALSTMNFFTSRGPGHTYFTLFSKNIYLNTYVPAAWRAHDVSSRARHSERICCFYVNHRIKVGIYYYVYIRGRSTAVCVCVFRVVCMKKKNENFPR